MINWVRIGISPAGFSRHRNGAAGNPADFAGAVGKTGVSNLSSAAPGSAIFSKHSSEAVVVGRPTEAADSAGPWRSAGTMSKLTSWLRWRKHCMVRRDRFRYAALVLKKRKRIR